MSNDLQILDGLVRHGVPFVIIGGHAVTFHGFARSTEDTDIVWLRSPASERALLQALAELDAKYIGKEIDPATGLERTYPVTLAFIQASPLMMLLTRLGFLDLFDYIPGFPSQDVTELFASSTDSNGLRFASIAHLRQMKSASGRSKDRLDLANLPLDDKST